MPSLLDLVWKPSAAQPTAPVDVYPVLAPAIYRNDSRTLTFILTEDADPYIPEGILSAQIRRGRLGVNATPGDPIAEFAVDVDGNVVTLTLTREQTETIPDSGCFWDLQEVFDDDTARTWFTGKVKAWGDTTRESGS